MQVIAFANQKGGCGKTTTVLNLGWGLALLGENVLLCDMDPQGNLTYSMGYEPDALEVTLYDVLISEAKLKDSILDSKGIALAPGNISLTQLEGPLAKTTAWQSSLKKSLKRIKGFDYCLIDCPPSLGVLTVNALVASNEVYIPLQSEFLALRGLSELLNTIDKVKQKLNPGLEVTGVIGLRYDSRKILNRNVIDMAKKHFKGKVFKTLIRENISLAEAPSYGQSIFEYGPKSHGAQDYLALSKEIIKRGRV